MSKSERRGPKSYQKKNDATRPKLHVKGVTSLAGNKFVKARKGFQRAFIPYHEFIPGGHVGKHLKDQGLVLTGPHFRELQHKVDELSSFPPAPLLERPGWTAGYFALPCGTVLTPKGSPAGRAIFPPAPEKCAKGGIGRSWRDEVAGLVAGQTLPAFLIMAAFAPPLLRLTDRADNFGFEVVGAKESGKTTILRLMATTAGAGLDAGQGVYWQTLGSTIAGLETSMQRHQDLPLLLDEAGLFMPKESRTSRAASMVNFAFQLGSGHPKARYGEPQPAQYRFVFVISSNEPASQTMQGNSHEREVAALDRLITLPVLDGGHGVFDSLPNGYTSGAEFSAAIDAAMRQHFGKALPRFLELLVDELAEGERELRERIARLMSSFREASGLNRGDGSGVRVCNAFGLVYAAGQIARSYQVLPESYDCMAIVLEAYRRHIATRDLRSPIKKILDLAGSDRVLKVPKGGKPKLKTKKIEAWDGLVFDGRKGRELLLTRRQFRRLFPLINLILEGGDLEFMLTRDNDHQTVKRKVNPSGKPKRFFCVGLSGLTDR